MRTLTRMLFAASLFTSITVFAGKLGEFKETPGLSPDQIAQMKKNSKYNVNSWSGDAPQDVTPFPWMAAGLALIVICGTLPFAWKMYQNTSKEMSDSNTFGAQGGSDAEE
ncbi:MAG: hypothetical protein ACJ790_07600 [Myxococcaceae bacterium]